MALSSIFVSISTGILFLGLIAWLLFIIHWLVKKAGIYRSLKFRRLSKRFYDYKFKDKIVLWCNKVIEENWKYEDVKRYLKLSNPIEKDEYLYTYLLLKKQLKGGLR